MSTNPIINAHTLSLSDIKYDAPKVSQNGSKSIQIKNKKSNQALILRSPLMLTWGVSDYEGNEKYELSLQFPSEEYRSEKVQATLDNMIALENKFKEDVMANSKAWLGKEIKNSDVLDALWSPMLKYPKDKATGEFDYSRSPTLRIKVPYYDGEWKMALFNMDKEKVFPSTEHDLTPPALVSKGSNIAAVFKCGGFWALNGKCGVTWRLEQGIVKPKVSLNDACQIDLDDDEKVTLTKQKIESDDEEEQGVTSAVVDDDDDVEEEEEEEEEEERPPTPPPVAETKTKKRVVKKKAAAA